MIVLEPKMMLKIFLCSLWWSVSVGRIIKPLNTWICDYCALGINFFHIFIEFKYFDILKVLRRILKIAGLQSSVSSICFYC